MQEVRRAVERIDNPAVRLVVPLDLAALLHEEAIALAGLGELAIDDFLSPLIGRRDEIRRALDRDLELRHLAEVARKAAPGLAGRPDHDVHKRGCGHGASVSCLCCWKAEPLAPGGPRHKGRSGGAYGRAFSANRAVAL